MFRLSDTLATGVAAFFLCASGAHAATLLDQQPDAASFADQEFNDAATFSIYMVDDVTFSGRVRITSVTTYFSTQPGTWPNNGTGVLNIFQGAALEASDDPSSGGDFGNASQSVSITDIGNGLTAVVAAGLDILLSAGSYWFGLTPQIPVATGQGFHMDAATANGAGSQIRNPNGGFNIGTGWMSTDSRSSSVFGDMAIKIEGDDMPVPGTPAIPLPAALPLALSGLGVFGLLARRRRNARPSP